MMSLTTTPPPPTIPVRFTTLAVLSIVYCLCCIFPGSDEEDDQPKKAQKLCAIAKPVAAKKLSKKLFTLVGKGMDSVHVIVDHGDAVDCGDVLVIGGGVNNRFPVC